MATTFDEALVSLSEQVEKVNGKVAQLSALVVPARKVQQNRLLFLQTTHETIKILTQMTSRLHSLTTTYRTGLPQVLMNWIFSFLPRRTRFFAQRVCRAWANLLVVKSFKSFRPQLSVTLSSLSFQSRNKIIPHRTHSLTHMWYQMISYQGFLLGFGETREAPGDPPEMVDVEGAGSHFTSPRFATMKAKRCATNGQELLLYNESILWWIRGASTKSNFMLDDEIVSCAMDAEFTYVLGNQELWKIIPGQVVEQHRLSEIPECKLDLDTSLRSLRCVLCAPAPVNKIYVVCPVCSGQGQVVLFSSETLARLGSWRFSLDFTELACFGVCLWNGLIFIVDNARGVVMAFTADEGQKVAETLPLAETLNSLPQKSNLASVCCWDGVLYVDDWLAGIRSWQLVL